MKLRITKRWRASKLPQTPKQPEKTGVGTAQTAKPPPLPPRSLGNPYGRLFTQDKSFADLLAKQPCTQTQQTGEAPTAQGENTTPDRAANTALTAPEKHPK